jgi:hypothetical protein
MWAGPTLQESDRRLLYRPTHDNLGVHNGIAVVLGDISNQREQFTWLLQINRSSILLCLRVDPRKPDRGERTNGLEARIGKVLLRRKVLEALCKFVASFENECIASGLLTDLYRPHGIPPGGLESDE